MAKGTKTKGAKTSGTESDNAMLSLNVPIIEFADNYEKAKSDGPNSELDLSGFDYKNLTGEKFKEYVRLVGDRSYLERNGEGKFVPVNGSLLLNDKYDFILLPAKPMMVERFPGMENSPWDYIGLKAKDTEAIHTTRIPVSTALEHNAQIINQHSRAGHGKYYFLKKN